MRSTAEIDQAIDAVTAELQRRFEIRDPMSAADWQAGWDAHPDLKAEYDRLYGERGRAQLVRGAVAFAKFNDTYAGEVDVVLMPRRSTRRGQRVTVYNWSGVDQCITPGYHAVVAPMRAVANARADRRFSDVRVA